LGLPILTPERKQRRFSLAAVAAVNRSGKGKEKRDRRRLAEASVSGARKDEEVSGSLPTSVHAIDTDLGRALANVISFTLLINENIGLYL
jgi:hypothetical protein